MGKQQLGAAEKNPRNDPRTSRTMSPCTAHWKLHGGRGESHHLWSWVKGTYKRIREASSKLKKAEASCFVWLGFA